MWLPEDGDKMNWTLLLICIILAISVYSAVYVSRIARNEPLTYKLKPLKKPSPLARRPRETEEEYKERMR